MISTKEGILAILVETGLRMDQQPVCSTSVLYYGRLARAGSHCMNTNQPLEAEAGSQHILPAKTGLSQPRVRDWRREPALSPL